MNFIRQWFFTSKRKMYQISTTILVNSYYFSFLKCLTFPVLNCYSCPLAIVACPIGTIQFFLSTGSVPYLTLGVIGLTGVTVGRMTCGWLCPFGFLQELLYKIFPQRIMISRKWGYIRYPILALTVFVLPLFLVDEFGIGARVFCELCPAGTLEAGIPQVLMDTSLQRLIGSFFTFKIIILLLVILLVLFIRRGFCRLFCPLGTMLGIFNRFCGIQIEVDSTQCNKCDACLKQCPVDLRIYEIQDSPSCIKCLECTSCDHVNYKFNLL